MRQTRRFVAGLPTTAGLGQIALLLAAAATWSCGSDSKGSSSDGGHDTASGGSSGADGGLGGADDSTSDTGGSANSGGSNANSGGSNANSGGSDANGSGGSSGGSTSGTSGGDAGSAGAGSDVGGFHVDYELASDVDPDAPGTVGIVTWSTDFESIDDARIEFGLTEDYGMTAPVENLDEAEFRTLLLGMKPEHDYHFRIVVEEGNATHSSDDYVIRTGPPTDLVSLNSFSVVDDSARQPGFILTSYFQDDGETVAFIIDADGDIVWWYDRGMRTMRASMSEDGSSMWMVTPANGRGGPITRVSMDTLDVQVYDDLHGSHDINPIGGDLMAYIDYGESDCDSLFEIDPSGEVNELFESGEYLETGECHGNAVHWWPDQELFTFSDADHDIFALSREGEVQWRLSELVEGGNAAWGGRTHGHQLLDDSLLILANRGGNGGDTTQVIEYSLNGEELMRYDTGIFSALAGDVQRLPQGNTLMSVGITGVIREIDADENTVLEIEGTSPLGYLHWRPTLYGPPPGF